MNNEEKLTDKEIISSLLIKIELLEDEIEDLNEFLNKNEVPARKNGNEYSLLGRVQLLVKRIRTK